MVLTEVYRGLETFKAVNKNVAKKQEAVRKRKIQKGEVAVFNIGDQVLIKNVKEQERKGGKMESTFLGPYVVLLPKRSARSNKQTRPSIDMEADRMLSVEGRDDVYTKDQKMEHACTFGMMVCNQTIRYTEQAKHSEKVHRKQLEYLRREVERLGQTAVENNADYQPKQLNYMKAFSQLPTTEHSD
ncbi:unnamed protein product [Boreogadus saida]